MAEEKNPTSFPRLCYCIEVSVFLQNGCSFVKTHFSCGCLISVLSFVMTSFNIFEKKINHRFLLQLPHGNLFVRHSSGCQKKKKKRSHKSHYFNSLFRELLKLE